ncbi:MAG: hypothetical protein ABI056_02805 [Caulobacteraceae bacterium]
MKTLFTIAGIGLALAGAASAADKDYVFKDKGSFTATGNITVTAAAVSLPCTAVLQGTTHGHPQITSAQFSGLTCLALTGSNFPWRMHAIGPHTFSINDVTVSAVTLGVCGPGKIRAQLNAAGIINISGDSLPGLVPCAVSGNLKSQPGLNIDRKRN